MLACSFPGPGPHSSTGWHAKGLLGRDQWEPAGFRAELCQFPLCASPQAFDAASLDKRGFFSSLLIQLLEKNALAEPCQVTQSISGENQPELVREAANLHSGKMSKGSNPGQAGAQERLEREPCWNLDLACCCSPCLGPMGTLGASRS